MSILLFSFSSFCFPWKKQLNMLACPGAVSFWVEVPYFVLSWQLLVFGLDFSFSFFFKSLFLGKNKKDYRHYRYFQREKTERFPYRTISLPISSNSGDTFCYFHLSCYGFNKVTYASSMNLTELGYLQPERVSLCSCCASAALI